VTEPTTISALFVCGYLILFTITCNVTLDRLLPMKRGPYGVSWVRSGTDKQKRIARTRAFWAGLFSPIVAPAWVLGWALYGLYKLITVPFRRLDS